MKHLLTIIQRLTLVPCMHGMQNNLSTERLEAIQWSGDYFYYTIIRNWTDGKATKCLPLIWGTYHRYKPNSLQVNNGDGVAICRIGDWIVKNENGEFEVIPGEVFAATCRIIEG